MSSTYQVSPELIAECWEAFAINKGLDTLDKQNIAAFKTQVMKMSDQPISAPTAVTGKRQVLASASVTPDHKRQQTAPPSTAPSNKSNDNSRRVSFSPAPPRINVYATQKPKYAERKDAGKVVLSYNPNKLSTASAATGAKPCTINHQQFSTNVQETYRHLFTTIDEKSRALDRQINKLQHDMVEKYGLGKTQDDGNGDVAPLEAVGIPRQETICCIGRICNAAHEGRINATSVMLEGDRHVSGGARVEVDLAYLKANKASYSLFPGQIVAVEGVNSSGRKMVAHRICEGASKAPMKSTAKDLFQYHYSERDGKPLKIVACAGPYTASDNSSYEPLVDFLNGVMQDQPDVVILSGPFVDMRHPLVATGQTKLEFADGEEVHVPYEAFFAGKVAALLEDFYGSTDSQTQFVLLPRLDDATAEMVYPQPPLADRESGGGRSVRIPGGEGIDVGAQGLTRINTASGGKRIHCVSNPCTLKINELVVGVTSTDVLFQISADETNANLEPGSRMTRISQHLLQQQSYYPLFPGPASLNLKKMNQWAMPFQPDLLILPSKLASFARPVLGNTLVLNPGHLTKDTTSGTYASVTVHPLSRDELEGDGDIELLHAMPGRTIVDIKRI